MIVNAIASLAVKDLSTTLPWYENLFGRPADSRPMREVAEWKFPRGGWLQVYEGPDRAGSGSCTLAVDDLDAQIAALQRMGIDPGPRQTSEKVDVIMVKDPDGNSLAFARPIDDTIAR